MDIRLVWIQLRNFKGTADRKIVFDGKNASVYGTNASGKTTIYDAFTWLLFDKNSLGVSAFDMKPVGLDRPEVEVSCVLSVDGKEIELKKILTEKWTKKRGEEQETLTGHESRFWINQIEKKQGDYKAFLDSIISEKDFRMLTSADYFLGLKKPEMRAVLVKMVGGVSDMDIAGSDQQLVDLVLLMQDKGWSSDDLLKLCKQNIALYNTEQTAIGPRMDEVRRAMPAEADYSQLEAGLTTAREYIKQIDERLSSSRIAALEANRKQMQVVGLRNKIDAYRRQRIEESNKAFYENKVKVQQAASAIQTAQAKLNTTLIDSLPGQIEEVKTRLNELAEQYKTLAAERKAIAEQVPEELADDALLCDKCGQPLPADRLAGAREAALIVFNRKQEASLKTIGAQIQQVVINGELSKAKQTTLEDRLAQAQEAYKTAEKEVELAKEYYLELSSLSVQAEPTRDLDLTGDPAYDAMQAELTELEASITTPEDKTDALLASKAKLEDQVGKINLLLKGREDREKAQARLEELTERGRQLSGLVSFEKARQFQVERFIRAKAERLESSINAMFSNISFRLFDVQINGGIVDDCEPLINNVSYKDASNSERIRGNLDICSAMQRVQGVTCPIFVDNAEAATYLRPMSCQLIRLVVSEPDKFLRVEVE